MRINDSEDRVWLVRLFGGNDQPVAFEDLEQAQRLAISAAGSACSSPNDQCYLYGPGDGTTNAMVESVPRELAFLLDVPIRPR
jgi:hypothetical protein